MAEPLSGSEVLELVQDVVMELEGVARDVVVPEAYFNVENKEDETAPNLGMDSLTLLELVMEFEESMGMKISDDDSMTLTTVQKAVDYIVEHQPENAREKLVEYRTKKAEEAAKKAAAKTGTTASNEVQEETATAAN